jgi:hypothetical protein
VDNATVANIRELVKQRDLLAAVESIEAWLEAGTGNWRATQIREWSDELILHVSSVERLQISARKGEMTKEQETVELVRISGRIMDLGREIERKMAIAPLVANDDNVPHGLNGKRILFLASNPLETDRLQIDEELRLIKQRLREPGVSSSYDVEIAWAVRGTELSKFLMQYRPIIVHLGMAARTVILYFKANLMRPQL